jgi:uncharacterized protein YndB with AHSA1/START domain
MRMSGGFDIETSIMIDAPQHRVFDLVADLRAWPLWNSNDPSVERSYDGAAGQAGATARWRSRRSGAGRMRISDIARPDRIVVQVDFDRPFRVSNVNTFTLGQEHGATSVRWSMRGPKPFVVKLLGVFVSAEKMMQGHFDTGLRRLKALAEDGVR